MKLDVKALALTSGILWGLAIFILTWWIIAFDGSSESITFLGKIYRGYAVTPPWQHYRAHLGARRRTHLRRHIRVGLQQNARVLREKDNLNIFGHAPCPSGRHAFPSTGGEKPE